MKTSRSKSTSCSLVGIPDHLGVLHVGGRLGAAYGPSAFRKAWARLSGTFDLSPHFVDRGDVEGLGSDISENHRIAAEFVRKSHSGSDFSIVVGGGHDHGFSHLLGIKEPDKRLGCINIDAHFDLREAKPVATSGSPFFLAIESGILNPKNFVEFGIQRQCNAAPLWDYAEKHKIRTVLFEDLRNGRAVSEFKKELQRLSSGSDEIVISLDLDALAQAYAPGVSAPQPEGFTPSEVFEMLQLAGANRKVVSLGLFELNPEHDRDDQTAKLAAVCAFQFASAALLR